MSRPEIPTSDASTVLLAGIRAELRTIDRKIDDARHTGSAHARHLAGRLEEMRIAFADPTARPSSRALAGSAMHDMIDAATEIAILSERRGEILALLELAGCKAVRL